MSNQIHNEEWVKEWEAYWDSKDTDHPMPFNAEFEAEIPGLKNLAEIKGQEWRKEISKFLSVSPTKDELISELGDVLGSPDANPLQLKPFNPDIESIDIFSEAGLAKKITFNFGGSFGLEQKQLILEL